MSGKSVEMDFKFTQDSEELFEKATECLQNDENEKAIELFDEIIKAEPENIHAYNGKGSALMQAGRFDEAEEVFGHSLNISEENVMAYLNKAILSRRKGDYETALGYCDRAVEIDPSIRNVFIGLRQDIFDDARQSAGLMNLDEYSDEARQLIIRGDELKDSNKLWDALEAYEDAVEKDASCRNAADCRIMETKEMMMDEFVFHDVFKDPKFGKADLQEVIDTAGNIMVALRDERIRIQTENTKIKAIEQFAERKYLSSMSLFEGLLDINGDDLDALNYRGALLFYFDDMEEAIECFEECLMIDYEYAYALFNKGLVLRKMGRLQEALEVFEKVLRDFKDCDAAKTHQKEISEKLAEQYG